MLGRIKASLEDPLGLEQAGYCLLDMYAERRGNLFAEEVYRLTKASDATTTASDGDAQNVRLLPPNHKLSNNDVIVLTQQPRGSGDFFTPQSLPVTDTAVMAEARILNSGPTYVDVAMSGGAFEAAFGLAANDHSNQGNRQLRLRVDRFVSNVSYQRMVAALSQLTAISENKKAVSDSSNATAVTEITMDETLREMILSTYAFTDPKSPSFHDVTVCNIEEIVRVTYRRDFFIFVAMIETSQSFHYPCFFDSPANWPSLPRQLRRNWRVKFSDISSRIQVESFESSMHLS